jgi:hypothetical protein
MRAFDDPTRPQCNSFHIRAVWKVGKDHVHLLATSLGLLAREAPSLTNSFTAA